MSNVHSQEDENNLHDAIDILNKYLEEQGTQDRISLTKIDYNRGILLAGQADDYHKQLILTARYEEASKLNDAYALVLEHFMQEIEKEQSKQQENFQPSYKQHKQMLPLTTPSTRQKTNSAAHPPSHMPSFPRHK